MIEAYAAHQPGGKLEPFTYNPGELGKTEVEINVEYCGLFDILSVLEAQRFPQHAIPEGWSPNGVDRSFSLNCRSKINYW